MALGNAFLVCQNNICFKKTGKNLGLTKYAKYAAVGAEQTHMYMCSYGVCHNHSFMLPLC